MSTASMCCAKSSKFRGALAQAAPKELAEITAELLIPKDEDDDESYEQPFA